MSVNRKVLRMATSVLALLFVATMVFGGVAANPLFTTKEVYCPVSDETTVVQLHQIETKAVAAAREKGYAEAAFYGEKMAFASDHARLSMVNDLFADLSDTIAIDEDLLYPHGPVIGYGVNYEAVFVVYIKEGLDVATSTMDKIYAKYEQAALAHNLTNVPVSFRYAPILEPERTVRRRPVFGGLQVQVSGGGTATLSYAARRGSTRGYVVSGHLAPNVNQQLYQ